MLLSYQNRRAKPRWRVTGERSFLRDTAAATIINDYPLSATKSATVANPNLRLLQLPAVATLRLKPLAFPQNPYHYLVKHYQDGSLRRGRLNDPELDARLALEVFADQQKAFREPDGDVADMMPQRGGERPSRHRSATTPLSRTIAPGHVRGMALRGPCGEAVLFMA